MDNNLRQFFDESTFYHACPACGELNTYSLAMAGTTQECRHCGLKIHLDQDVILDTELEEMRADLEEYLRDVHSAKKSD